jgi:hypothetical protein
MRLELRLPRVEPREFKMPLVCPHQGCQGRHFRHHKDAEKPVKDTKYDDVSAQCRECRRCKRSFQVCSRGDSCPDFSAREGRRDMRCPPAPSTSLLV